MSPDPMDTPPTPGRRRRLVPAPPAPCEDCGHAQLEHWHAHGPCLRDASSWHLARLCECAGYVDRARRAIVDLEHALQAR